MNVTAAVLRKMLEKGLTLADVVEIAEAWEIEPPTISIDPALARRRAYDRERMRAKRAEEVRRQSADSPPTSLSPKNGTAPSCNSENQQTPIPPKTPLSGVKKVPPVRRCPVDWVPSLAVLAFGEAEGFTSGEIERELARFRDHTFGTPRSDWNATFRNWLRKSSDDRKAQAARHDDKFARHQANLARAFASSGSAAGRTWEP